MELRNRRRLQFGLILAIFVVPVVVMLALALAGWSPRARSYGQQIKPALDLSKMPVRLAGGAAFDFQNHAGIWTLVALPGPECVDACLRQLDLVHRAQIGLSQQAERVRLLYLGPPPDGPNTVGFDRVWTLASTSSGLLDAFRASGPDTVSAVLVAPTGGALIRYAPHFDVAGVQQDLQKAMRR